MEFVQTRADIIANLKYLEDVRHHEVLSYKDLIKKGICFVAYCWEGEVHFAPSRFIGYKQNTFRLHGKNESKNGTETNPVIIKILGGSPVADDNLNKQYLDFCRNLGFDARDTGSFGVERKFWDCTHWN